MPYNVLQCIFVIQSLIMSYNVYAIKNKVAKVWWNSISPVIYISCQIGPNLFHICLKSSEPNSIYLIFLSSWKLKQGGGGWISVLRTLRPIDHINQSPPTAPRQDAFSKIKHISLFWLSLVQDFITPLFFLSGQILFHFQLAQNITFDILKNDCDWLFLNVVFDNLEYLLLQKSYCVLRLLESSVTNKTSGGKSERKQGKH